MKESLALDTNVLNYSKGGVDTPVFKNRKVLTIGWVASSIEKKILWDPKTRTAGQAIEQEGHRKKREKRGRSGKVHPGTRRTSIIIRGYARRMKKINSGHFFRMEDIGHDPSRYYDSGEG